MFVDLFYKIFGTKSSRALKKMASVVEKINSLENTIQRLNNDELKNKTVEFRQRLSKGETLDDILPEAFAVVRETSVRIFGKRHFDAQLYGGIVLHKGMVAEMKTGEGKTLVSTLPCYLNGLAGSVHVVTVNEYLAQRDRDSMGMIYEFLGLSVGCIFSMMDDDSRRKAYQCDIVYGTNSEFGFDYLRDHMKNSREEMCQSEKKFAIVDEVDNILIDEARTPLIISGASEIMIDGEEKSPAECFQIINDIVVGLTDNLYEKDEKDHAVYLTEDGISHIEKELRERNMLAEGDSLYELRNKNLQHYISQSLKANHLFKKNIEYVVEHGKIVIIDEFTGRKMEGRRYSDGLHQAIEAKEKVRIQEETQTLASTTLQNYFKMYQKLAGMTGTALTEATEFGEIYGLEIIAIPTHRKMIRKDFDDEVYRTFQEKLNAIIKTVEECRARKQPVLLGTVSIEKSEIFSAAFKKHGIPHNVLNAKNHAQEASIIENAGLPGIVTIATNMAGRGTDIQLGGDPEIILRKYIRESKTELTEEEIAIKKAEIEKTVIESKKIVEEAGGLYVIGTERHESRRIDNQLRGRSGRQGDKGQSKFFLSLEDDLMRIFGSERLDMWLKKLGLKEGEAIVHPWVNKSLEKAQERVEARNYSSRKNLVKYDEVMGYERKTIYNLRNTFVDQFEFDHEIRDIIKSAILGIISKHIDEETKLYEVDLSELTQQMKSAFGCEVPFAEWIKKDGTTKNDLIASANEFLLKKLEDDQSGNDAEFINRRYKRILIGTLDKLWRSHLLMTDHLRGSIHLRSYGQKDPVIEYKNESFALFSAMFELFNVEVCRSIFVSHNFSNQNESSHNIDVNGFDFNQLNINDLMQALIGDFAAESSNINEGNDNSENNDEINALSTQEITPEILEAFQARINSISALAESLKEMNKSQIVLSEEDRPHNEYENSEITQNHEANMELDHNSEENDGK